MATLAHHRVEHLHVRLPDGQATRAEQVRRAVLLTRWPELGEDEIVVVRRVHLRTAWGDLDRTLGERLTSAIAHGEHRRFATAAALLTELSRDLAQGTAAQKWWWQSWSDLLRLPPSTALARLWSRHVVWLPEVIAELERTHALAEVWRQWTPEQAAQVLAEVIDEHQLPWSPATVIAHAERVAADPANGPDVTSELALPARLLRRWQTLLGGLPPADPRTLLALVLDGLVYAPLSLSQPRGADTVIAWSAQIRAANTSLPVAEGARARPASLTPNPAAEVDTAPRHSPAAEQLVPTAKLDPRASTGPSSTSNVAVVPPPAARISTPDDVSTPTAFAGVVFLVNVLRHPHVQDLIDTTGWFTDVPHAWHLVVALARHLGWAAEDPLAQALEALLESDGTTYLATPAIGAALASCAAELYGDEVWNPRLLQEVGRFHLTASHVDVWLPLSAVRLPLRLAGLDLTPGWTPWLGRVVTIHFVTDRRQLDVPAHHPAEDHAP